MTTDFVWIYPHRTTEATIRKIREIAPTSEFIYYLYVLDKADHLLGTISLRTLLLELPTAFIDRIMNTDTVTVSTDTPAMEVAATIARYDLLAVPVLRDDGVMLGIVTVDDAIDAIIPERLKKQLPRFTKHRRHERIEHV
jgi:Mg/Co/Ni transporter MgtE